VGQSSTFAFSFEYQNVRKIIDYLLSTVFMVYFGILLVVFHGIQWLCYTIGGNRLHQKSVNALNFFIVKGWLLTGSTVKARFQTPLPSGRPLIFIANHQSMFDIPGIIWYWRKYTPLFVSKKELAKGIPSISYNLRVGKAALIDRNDGKSAIIEIARLGKYISDNNFSAAIFPEGTRSRTGQLKDFQVGGVATLIKRCPNALVVPLAIKNTARFNPSGIFPLRAFTKLYFKSLTPIDPTGKTPQEVVDLAKSQIEQELKS
jgi:1-acyl-sn-glycerol-3-phosphate acyltransferase